MEPVAFTDLNYVGQRATLIIEPNPEWLRGIYWKTDKLVEVTPSIAHYETMLGSRLRLRQGIGWSLEIIEHILPIVYYGLTDFTISCDHRLPPFLPAGALWNVVKEHCLPDGNVTWITSTDERSSAYKKLRNGMASRTVIRPAQVPGIHLHITISYPGMGIVEKYYQLPDSDLLDQILATPTQGWPPRNFRQSQWASHLPFWHNHDRVIWPQEHEDALELFALHRAQDILGALALLCRQGNLFACEVGSVCSGHGADLKVVAKLHNYKRLKSLSAPAIITP